MKAISWFSCGAASAVATKLALNKYDAVDIVYCEVKEEHPDNLRFLEDCQRWFNHPITIIGNDKYNRSIYEVFDRRRYLSGVNGAPCTGLLKKQMREAYPTDADITVIGYTVEESRRVDNFIDANNHIDLDPILCDFGLTKLDVLAMVDRAGIALPVMYGLGFEHNNCIGCVKSESVGYWKLIKQHFPDQFARMVEYEKRFNVRICKANIDGEKDVRIPLTELPNWIPPIDKSGGIQCGVFCELAEQTYK